ncbi:hypothetical protein PAXRUDRAFT_147949 [Paxillus rubicundulus Ve08.2h10]|uniref:ubiquitinyl hydrolase 1 n=1 Tax=Paxillus rubicundulus Ve08.2h10 TaxID=930991 RepID=A0A0D0E4G6_9AGAM|nr:hypothetical protein PAXRUDRAFT_147949 [Paxillus rubicundulus Ve08.2h10]
MFESVLHIEDDSTLKYILTHVFSPLRLPDGDDYSVLHEHALAGAIWAAARAYIGYITDPNKPQWSCITTMLEKLAISMQSETLDSGCVTSQLHGMKSGDVLAYLIRAHNAAVIFRKRETETIFESFEVSPMAGAVMSARGKLVCSYPGPAIAIPNSVFNHRTFQLELANFLDRMSDDPLDSAPTSRKAQSTVTETRDTAHPRYIAELLTGILRGVGRPINIVRIRKRIGDDVVWNNSRLPWRRSSLWLLLRVVLQTSLERTTLGRDTYKAFMIFLMHALAQKAIEADLETELLHFISAKVSRRLVKLGLSAPDWLSRAALQTCTSIRETIEARWGLVQDAQAASPSWVPSQIDLVKDTQLSLLGSRGYIRDALWNQHASTPNSTFSPKHHSRGTLDDFLSSDGQFFENAYIAEPHLTLHDVEQAVEQGIDDWVARVTDADNACVKLELLADNYSSGALKTYTNNPENLSIMLLTTIELWVALDKVVIGDIPMLADYSPVIHTTLLEYLLVRKAENLHRLCLAQQYIRSRRSRSRYGSVFSEEVCNTSFGVRFYNTSPRLKELKDRIEEAAQQERDRKIKELDKANVLHAKLSREASNIDHTLRVDWYGNDVHVKRKNCPKCQLEKRLETMTILVHEWPLPAEPLHAAVLMFELQCPVSFNMWRSATSRLLIDICSPSLQQKKPYILLDDYTALQPYLVQHPRSRVSLASDTKPFVKTHYKATSIPSTNSRVCVNNGLKFYGFDGSARICVSEVIGDSSVKRYCTYQLPSGPYQRMQEYIDGTLHTSNQVLANQADCHKDLGIHEFLAFGHLRSGPSIQWLNILRELRDRTLSYRRHEVHLLLAQAVSQVGPLAETGKWMWHQELQHQPFCHALLGELESLVMDVSENWLEGVTMNTITLLLNRLLASGPSAEVSEAAFTLLRSVREKTFSWVKELSAKLMKAVGDIENEGFRRRLRSMAAICRSSCDVSPAHIRKLLHSPKDVKVLLSCSVFIHDNTPSELSSIDAYSRLLLERDRRLSRTLEGIFSDLIMADDDGIDLAISEVWSAYRPGSKWQKLSHPNSRWFTCQTAATTAQCSQVVHFNLLDGSLLVDGKPLGRLPDAIMQHPMYALILGKQVFDVTPSDLPGMEFSTRGMISGHQVHFALNGGKLVIRAKHKSKTDIWELIPQEKMNSDLPVVLVKDHAHWMNLSTSTIEVRPLKRLWEPSPENWTISSTPSISRMRKGSELFVDIRSRTWAMISSLLKPLDLPEHLIITVSPVDSVQQRLSVDLPRYGLSFFVDEDGDLQSYNIRGMVYDKNQSIGTMFGLANQLVLRPKPQAGHAPTQRCVLIPEGDISFERHGHHVRINVDTHRPPLRRVTYQTYKVDTELGCLTGNVSLTNKLYRAYIHALSSGGCSVDPLTGRTGTEEALSILRSASCRSFMKHKRCDAEILCQIASLCPMRVWYPKHLKHMQKVEWLCLPAIAQHHGLYTAAKAIKEHCEKVQSFHENHPSSWFSEFPAHDVHLLERGALRAAHLHPFEFSGQLPKGECDAKYQARDVLESTSKEHHAYSAASAVYCWATDLNTTENIVGLLESWKTVVHGGAQTSSSLQSLQYDSTWLHPNLPLIWIRAYNLLRKSAKTRQRFHLLFTLPAMAYGSPDLDTLVPTLLAFATNPQFLLEDPPPYDTYDLSRGYSPSSHALSSLVLAAARPFENSPESTTSPQPGETVRELRLRQRSVYDRRLASDVSTTVKQLLVAWPSESPPPCPSLTTPSYNVLSLTASLHTVFTGCYRNLQLREHLGRVQNILSRAHSLPPSLPRYAFQPCSAAPPRVSCAVTLGQLFIRCTPPSLSGTKLPHYTTVAAKTPSSSSIGLRQLTTSLWMNSNTPFQRKYVDDFTGSVEQLGAEMALAARTRAIEKPTTEVLEQHHIRCRDIYFQSLDALKQALFPQSMNEHAIYQAGQWPRTTADALFRCLASTSLTSELTKDWKNCLISLALLGLELQRSRRLLRLAMDSLFEEFFKELENEGCEEWNAEQYPDWLLIQLQGNFLVRRVQANVAFEMISPESNQNTVMQLHMGEGKSSVIVPIAVAALANGNQLVRVVVPKVLTAQMFQLLVDRLGGLTNRRIYYLPFSRSLETDSSRVNVLREMLQECKQEGGILVVQPDHVLSLKLMSVEKQLNKPGKHVADELLKLQIWLHSHSRDILDESDEILHVRYQLVYTIGLQTHLEGFPERWTTTQQVLDLVRKHAPSIRDDFPLGVEFECGPPGSFPHTRILQANAGQELISRIAKDVMNGVLPNFSFDQVRFRLRNAIHNFISCRDATPLTIQMVEEYARHHTLWGRLLLLRGLLASGILMFALKERRWRVDYGLAPARTMLAVPYRAKDIPAPKAEFGHPDVAIALTCLSYYYGGLTEQQLRTCFEILLKQDNPSLEYGLWVRSCPTVPDALRTLRGVNTKSSEQWRMHLVPLFARTQAVVDFYLAKVVFPKEAKEFPSKLSCSGWDLAENRTRLITGFSGTNDGRYLLPTSISQRDPEHQRGTNARVLAYLLQPENNSYKLTAREDGSRRTADEFLQMVVEQKPEIRVLLDVGAQMLELQNDELAAAWLKLSPGAHAAIYFNEDDELTVVTRDGTMQLLLSSPFAQQLDQCVVYLDDAHTRGTDIKFPDGCRAAVTLGPKVTKDRLAQGCMRMRKLGHGHSVMFFAPLEVDRSIRAVAAKATSDRISVTDILQWAIHETCNDIQQRASHWVQQGMDHTSRYSAWSRFCRNELTAKQLSNAWLQSEAKSLVDLYAPRNSWSSTALMVPEIRQRCLDLGILSLRDASMDEEQEREVIHEIEREQQVQRPNKVPPAKHSIHGDVVTFVKNGVIPAGSSTFRPIFATLENTTAITHEDRVWSPFILATEDFRKTVAPSAGKTDDYLRPVHWILSGKVAHNSALVILSPHEVNGLMADIRNSKCVHLHVYTPRTIQSMKPCDDLSLYSVPTVPLDWTPPLALMDQLNVFAGQLYLRDYATYIRLCRFLCIYAKDLQDEDDIEVQCDGFIAPQHRPLLAQSNKSFQCTPLPSLKALVGLRRKGMSYAPTHMGKILEGRPLTERDFQDGPDDVSFLTNFSRSSRWFDQQSSSSRLFESRTTRVSPRNSSFTGVYVR